MRILAVQQPWASLIAEGKKSIEIRNQNTKIRETIAIYATRTDWDRFLADRLPECSSYIQGHIIATAELTDCKKYEDPLEFIADSDNHLITRAPPYPYQDCYAWHLDNIKKLEKPIKYKMPKGCVVWANAEI